MDRGERDFYLHKKEATYRIIGNTFAIDCACSRVRGRRTPHNFSMSHYKLVNKYLVNHRERFKQKPLPLPCNNPKCSTTFPFTMESYRSLRKVMKKRRSKPRLEAVAD